MGPLNDGHVDDLSQDVNYYARVGTESAYLLCTRNVCSDWISWKDLINLLTVVQ